MDAITKLKNQGIITAILTNNWKSEKNGRLIFKDNLEIFDHVIESCLVGMRKPEINIYEHTLKTLGVSGKESIFLDDIPGRGVSSLGSARNLAREPRVLKISARSSQAY